VPQPTDHALEQPIDARAQRRVAQQADEDQDRNRVDGTAHAELEERMRKA